MNTLLFTPTLRRPTSSILHPWSRVRFRLDLAQNKGNLSRYYE